MGARETALQVLIACRREDGWSNALLKEQLAKDRLDRREAALASRLCYGVLQNRLKLDFYLQQLLNGKLRDLHPAVRDILHLGLYQLFETDRIPESAAVNESVALAKKYCGKNRAAAGLVNGVLRSAIRDREQLMQPRSYVEKYSHPQALVDLLKGYVGKELLEGMLQANNQAPQTTVQVNTMRCTSAQLQQLLLQEGVRAEPHSWMENCLVLSATGSLEQLESFQKGLFYVQDPAAKLAVAVADLPKEGCRVLDCCAAPGGKSFAAAIAMEGQGSVLSCDIHPHKLKLLENGVQRLGLSSVSVRLQDGSQREESWVEKMDAVICDVPCSGYGIIRKKPDIRYKDPATMTQLPQLQLAILENQSHYVRPGGTLVYSTCTLVREENEGVVETFLERNPEFHAVKLKLPEAFPENTTGMLRLVPGQYDTDGFFICKMQRNGLCTSNQ